MKPVREKVQHRERYDEYQMNKLKIDLNVYFLIIKQRLSPQ
jgi:hypothetical protein